MKFNTQNLARKTKLWIWTLTILEVSWGCVRPTHCGRHIWKPPKGQKVSPFDGQTAQKFAPFILARCPSCFSLSLRHWLDKPCGAI